MTVTREEGEIKQNGPFKKYYFIMDGREEKRFRIQKLHCRGRVRQVCGCENSAGFSVTMTLCLLFVHFSPPMEPILLFDHSQYKRNLDLCPAQ